MNYLDKNGVQYLWNKMKSYIASHSGGGFTYSTNEKWTGDYWVDGKKIYQKTLQIGSKNANASYSTVLNDIDQIWFDTSNSFYIEGGSINSGNRWPINGNFGDANANGYAVSGRGPYYIPSTKKLCWDVPKSGCSNAYITYRYTKLSE